jgi:hypothetical protein
MNQHQEQLDKLYQETKSKVQASISEKESYQETIKTKLKDDFVLINEAKLYRDQSIIDQDYNLLYQKERDLAQEKVALFTAFKEERLVEHKKILKDTTALIKTALKPYKKYIRYASRGLNAEKKELTRKSKRALKKALAEAKSNLEIQLQ